MAKKLRSASSFSAFAQEAARAAVAEIAIFAPVIRRRLALEKQLIVDEPGYTPDPDPMPAKAPRAMLYPTRSQVENGYITGQPTVPRQGKPGPKAEPKTKRRSTKGPRR